MAGHQQRVSRREFLKRSSVVAAGLSFSFWQGCGTAAAKPNIVFILADDLGYAELGCYGQEIIQTPNLDQLAAEGMRFTQHYAGSPVCAPSRCSLLTGKHTGHAYIRANDEMPERGDVWHDPALEGQRPIPEGMATVATYLKQAGYATACIGKWGLGGPGSPGHPNRHGFDLFFGYLCQRQAHNHYPDHLWRNEEKVVLEGNPYFFPHQKFPKDKDPDDPENYRAYRGEQYAPDLMADEAIRFIRENRNRPFFLYFATTLPHLALQAPEEVVELYRGKFPDTPYLGDRGYLPNRTPRATYAAMITRMDQHVGRIVQEIERLGLSENTLIVFSSDNGTTYTGGVDYRFFRSVGPLRGLKGSLYEGGIRVPMIARWKEKIHPGTVSEEPTAFWDFLPTFCELAGVTPPADTDGISLLPILFGKKEYRRHEYLYWEFPSYGGQQAVRIGDWKGVRRGLKRKDTDTRIQLYNLKEDIGETTNVAERHPEVVARIKEIMVNARVESDLFPMPEIYQRPW
jgi:arylsulfatase